MNTYSGGTTVSAGTLLVNGSIGGGAVTVANGILGGNGSIGGAVTVQPGGTLAPGNGIGILVLSNAVMLQPGSTTMMEISKTGQTNDQLLAGGALAYGGTLVVTNLGGPPALGDSYQLFQAGSIIGNYAAYALPPIGPSLGWNTANLSSGVLSVISAVPTNLVWSVSGSNLTLSWPADHTGWRLLMQSNNLANGISANPNDWAAVSGSSMTNIVTLSITPALSAEFYRLVFP